MPPRSSGDGQQIDPNTGIASLDTVFQGLRWGDNVVWQVEQIEDYVPFVDAYLAQAQHEGRTIIYFRFAKHAPLVDVTFHPNIRVIAVRPDQGFESFVTEIRSVIEQVGRRGLLAVRHEEQRDAAVQHQHQRALRRRRLCSQPLRHVRPKRQPMGVQRHARR